MAESSNRQAFIIITVIMLLILTGWLIYLIVASSTETGPFKPYQAPTSSDFWYPRGTDAENAIPLTEEQLALKQSLLKDALNDVNAAINLNAPTF